MLPTGYAFNLDCTSIYVSLCVLFITNAYGVPMSWEQQLGTIAIMLVTSKARRRYPVAASWCSPRPLRRLAYCRWKVWRCCSASTASSRWP